MREDGREGFRERRRGGSSCWSGGVRWEGDAGEGEGEVERGGKRKKMVQRTLLLLRLLI